MQHTEYEQQQQQGRMLSGLRALWRGDTESEDLIICEQNIFTLCDTKIAVSCCHLFPLSF